MRDLEGSGGPRGDECIFKCIDNSSNNIVLRLFFYNPPPDRTREEGGLESLKELEELILKQQQHQPFGMFLLLIRRGCHSCVQLFYLPIFLPRSSSPLVDIVLS